MFKRASLGTKIIAGYLLIVAMVAMTGGVGYRGLVVVGKALHIVGDEEAPVVDAANEMKLSLMETRDTLGEFKAASAAVATANEKALDGIVAEYQRAVANFDSLAEAILKGKQLGDGTVVIKTDNEELARLVEQSQEIHDAQFQTAAAGMMQAGRQLLKDMAETKAAMQAMEQVFEEVLKGASAAKVMIAEEISKRASEANIDKEALAILAEEVPLADMANEIKLTVAETRLAVEEFVQARTPAELEAIEKEY